MSRDLIQAQIESMGAEREVMRSADPGAFVGMGDWRVEARLIRSALQCPHTHQHLADLGTFGTGFASVYCSDCGEYLREWNH